MDTIIKRGVVGTPFFVPVSSQHLDFWSLCSMGVVPFVDGFFFLPALFKLSFHSPDRVKPKTIKLVFVASLLGTQR